MRKLFIILLLLTCGKLLAQQQPYNNEWIDYSKTYYKFKVGTTGLYRIPQILLKSTLLSNGTANLASIPAEQFQLWRNGKQIPLSTSIVTGLLGANDYIEFWGEKNDGQPDKYLYRSPEYQQSDRVSLQTDTAAFFLTFDPVTTNNLRYTATTNDVASNTLPALPYFMYSLRYNFRDYINRGLATNVGENVYSASYDRGEFLSTNEIQLANSPYTVTNNNLFVATTGPAATLTAGFAANSLDTRSIQLSLNNNLLLNPQLGSFGAGVFTNASVPLSTVSSNNASFSIKIITSDSFDRVVCSFIDFQYPRQFNFGGSSSFPFSLPASAQGNYIEISNFNAGSSTPVLYDITNMRSYTANTAVAGLLRFVIQPTNSTSNFVLVNEDAANSTQVSSLQQRSFINFASTANQGDYLIISNKILMAGSINEVAAYQSYRSSTAGGSFNAKVYDIDELVDQFAFGIKKHPLSIKNFIRYATQTFTKTPSNVLLIGKGTTYEDYWYNQSSPNADKLNLVPTWGWPASDMLLASPSINPIPAIAIGRISVVSPQELAVYLDKVITFESIGLNAAQTIAQRAWMKQFVNVSGANDLGSSDQFIAYLNGYETIIRDTLMGGTVADFNKNTTGTATPIANAYMAQLFASGISLLTYFGHSAATVLDYNLNDPSVYNNTGKYPFFLVNGCSAGNFFDYDTSRFVATTSLAEKFVLAPQKGTIGFIADTHFGLTDQLDTYSTGFFKSLSGAGYNKPVFKNMADAITALQIESNNFTSSYDSFLSRMHAEEILLHGDPALKLYASAKPDYVMEDPQVVISPSIITVANNQFSVKAYLYNIGEALNDSVNVLIKRQYPDGTTANLFNQKIKPLKYMDSIILNIPIVASRDKGNNSITITIDNDNKISEISESNNTVTKSFVIFDDDINPAYPYNFSIINKSSTKLIASTANPLAVLHQYAMEIDTTELFNSPFKVAKTATSIGGELEFDPGITFTDSTVYYWRVATVPTSGAYRWNTSSFVYLSSGGVGYNQSHLYQHLKSATSRIALDSTSRRWKYLSISSNFIIRLGLYPRDQEDAMFATLVNGQIVGESACAGHSLIFMVFDPITLQPLYNQPIPAVVQNGTLGGFMGSAAFCKAGREHNFEFSYLDTTGRRKMRDFMDWVPDGYIVSARLNLDDPYNEVLVDTWKNDAAIYGANNTAYSRLKGVGFSDLDSFYYPRVWGLVYQKNTPSFTPQWSFSQGLTDVATLNTNIASSDTLGYITSPKFGPVAAWHQLKWRGYSLDAQPGDAVQVSVVGIDTSGNATTLYNLNSAQQDFDLSSVSATQYPYMQLVMRDADSIHVTPYQLRYWRLLADAVPEGAVAPNIKYNFTGDTLGNGQPLNVALAFKNISDVAFRDSVKVQMQVINSSNVTQTITVAPLKKIAAGDTATVITTIDTKSFTGSNTLYINLNPNNAQPEQYLFNNFVYKNFYVKGDAIKPLLDVTFDGVHILNGDIVSAKPLIHVKLTDENQYVALDDTSLINVQLQYPDNSVHRYRFGSDTLRFTPANLSTGQNVATVDFSPALSVDGTYILMVQGKDKSNNAAGVQQYNVSFDVYNKPMISNVFNYPNPFTTSTAFVFTLTGSVIPQNIKIQILTVTGKIVREITKDELGPIHIGNNITQFKWNGTDMYGSKLANGVYLYRVVTNLNGNSLDKFPTGDQGNTDKYFKAGYGKMYLMR